MLTCSLMTWGPQGQCINWSKQSPTAEPISEVITSSICISKYLNDMECLEKTRQFQCLFILLAKQEVKVIYLSLALYFINSIIELSTT